MQYRNNRYKRVSSFGSIAVLSIMVASVWAYAELQNGLSVVALNTTAAAIQFINPKSRNNGEKRLPVTPTPLYVELDWGDGLPHDIDLWIRCYNDHDGLKANLLTVGYKRTSEGWMDLQRDDLGAPSYINKEVAQSNSDVAHIPGFTVCQFNAHLFHSHGGPMPVQARMLVVQDKDSEHEKAVADVKFMLNAPGQEITVVYATWDGAGVIQKDSVKKYPDAPQLMIATVPAPTLGQGGTQ